MRVTWKVIMNLSSRVTVLVCYFFIIRNNTVKIKYVLNELDKLLRVTYLWSSKPLPKKKNRGFIIDIGGRKICSLLMPLWRMWENVTIVNHNRFLQIRKMACGPMVWFPSWQWGAGWKSIVKMLPFFDINYGKEKLDFFQAHTCVLDKQPLKSTAKGRCQPSLCKSRF